jgi:heparin/heparan-sulfate lyase
VIGKGGWLALDSGVYDAETKHRGRYYARTIAHNTITVTDPNEEFPGGTWGYGEEGQGPNDGGQLCNVGPTYVTDVQPDDEYHRGRIVTYEATDHYVFVVGDTTRSYNPAKLKEFTRAFLYIRPDVFIIFDRVESTDPAYKKRWLLHSATEPELAEDEAEIVSGDGRMALRRVLPQDAEVTVVGGPGHEFEVNGTNYAPGRKCDAQEAGNWRIEVSPREPQARDYFLNVMVTGGARAEVRPEVSGTADAQRAAVRVRYGGADIEASFSGEGPLRGHLTIRDPGTNEVLCDANLGGP